MAAPKSSRSQAALFYWRDFVSDPAVKSMTLAERGAYITLLCHAAMMPEPGVLPDDDKILAKLSEAGAYWPRMRPAISRAFEVGDGLWVQKRLFRDQKDYLERRLLGTDHARKAATARWQKKKLDDKPDAQCIIRAMPEPCLPSPSPNPKDLEERRTDARASTDEAQAGDPAADLSRLRGLISGLAGVKSAGAKEAKERKPTLDASEVDAFLKGRGLTGANLKRHFLLAGWLWKTGTEDTRIVIEMLAIVLDVKIENWYAYFAAGTETRLGVETRAREAVASQDKARWAQEDSRLLGHARTPDEPSGHRGSPREVEGD